MKKGQKERNSAGNTEKKLALVTGASGGIGRAIAEKISEMGYFVYGIGRDFKEEEGSCPFLPVRLNLRDAKASEEFFRKLKSEGKLSVLVHSAGVAYYGFHESLNAEKIMEMTEVNFTIPLSITQYFLRDLKEEKGHIFFLSSVTALHENGYGAAYGATKAGLLSFARSLFSENRKSGLQVHSILPDMTDSNLYRNADFTVGKNAESYLLPSDVASAVEMMLRQRAGVVLEEVHLRPQLFQITRRPSKTDKRT